MFRLKRIYAEPETTDGRRILVERLWPRGITRERAALTEWRKDLAPSPELRIFFGHDPSRWEEFRRRYREELASREEALAELRRLGQTETVTLVYAARDEEHNGAVVLKEVLEQGG